MRQIIQICAFLIIGLSAFSCQSEATQTQDGTVSTEAAPSQDNSAEANSTTLSTAEMERQTAEMEALEAEISTNMKAVEKAINVLSQ